MPPRRKYWLFKSEPDAFSIQDLAEAEERTTSWDGVRNYQARNILRDEIRVGDGVLYYHSNAKPPGVVGTARVVKAGYPDHTAWTTPKGRKGHDPKSGPDDPRWYMVDIRLESVFPRTVGLPELKENPRLADMMVVQKGSRLSVQPVTAAEWKEVLRMAKNA